MDKSYPFVTIVVPTYNRAELLIPTLDKLLAQDTDDYEVIVVDDGSTDDTEVRMKDYSTRVPEDRFRYYRKTNGERGAARNFGAARAKGKYVNFFDSDDLPFSNHVSLAKQCADENGHTEVFALSYVIRDPLGKVLKNVRLDKPASEFLHRGNHLSCNGVFVRREIALLHPFSEIRELSGSEDYELWLRLAAHYPFPCFPTQSHSVIHHPDRSTLNFYPAQLVKRKLLMLELVENNGHVKMKFGQKKHILQAGVFSYIALHIALSGKAKFQSVKWLGKAILSNPGILFEKRSWAVVKWILRP